MIVRGIVASNVHKSDKGVSFKVMIPELGDTFRSFIPSESVSQEGNLKITDACDVTFEGFFASGSEVRINVKSVVPVLKSVK